MGKTFEINVDEKLKEKSRLFIKNTKSGMYYKSEIDSVVNDLEWLKIIEDTCPYIDNIIRAPKVALITETEVQQIEKAKKIGVDSVKDLAKHTNYIDKVDEVSSDVQPSKILVLLREETYNTYENRFMYTLIHDLSFFILEKEELLKNLETKNEKKLEYSSSTDNGEERIKIQLKISSRETANASGGDDDLKNQIEEVRERLQKVRNLITIWQRSAMITSLDNAHVPLVVPPLKKTNLILKNPNFKMATTLWSFLRNYTKDESKKSKSLANAGNDTLKSILDDAFLTNYFVLDSISKTKKAQKEKLTQYAIIMIMQQVQSAVVLLLNNGIKVTEEELLQLISIEMSNDKSRSVLGSNDIKKKFKKEIDEYLSKVQQEI